MKQCIQNYLPVSGRVILIKINGQPFDINLIQVYGPNLDSSEEDIKDFYTDIEKTRIHIKASDINVYLRDCNAKLGAKEVEHIVGPHGLGNRGSFIHGSPLRAERKLLSQIKSTIYQLIDDFVTVCSVQKHPGCDINSDHNPVVATVRI